MTSAADSLNEIATLRIELVGADPLIWRQVDVPTSITLTDVHDVVQAAMGWCDQHLWALRLGRQRYGQPMTGDDWGDPPVIRADTVRLREVLKPAGTVMDYTYDFGDDWEHRLTFTDIRSGDPEAEYPHYVAGERCAPPEDCGGLPGFYDALDVLADPTHPDHADVADWFDGYDPDRIDEAALKIALSRMARRHDTAKAR
jgi:hypothetical protein